MLTRYAWHIRTKISKEHLSALFSLKIHTLPKAQAKLIATNTDCYVSHIASMKLDLGDQKLVLNMELELKNPASDGSHKLHSESTARVAAYVDRAKLPLWVLRGAVHVCLSESSTTAAFFRSKLLKKRHVRRGIVAAYEDGYCMFYACLIEPNETLFEIQCVELDLVTVKQQLDLQLPRNTMLDSGNALDHLVERKQRQQLRSRSRVSEHAQLADMRRQFLKTAASCIRSGLRLRGMPEGQPEFHTVYKTTLSTVEFAHRHDLTALPSSPQAVSFETVQDTVETVLRLFTHT
ncbi:LAFA_0D15918g1_1 [Lachancea sp. 'fantastica']|nr:LAFA_0D15918g1_1 [Lachancea sp. 'fantastica']